MTLRFVSRARRATLLRACCWVLLPLAACDGPEPEPQPEPPPAPRTLRLMQTSDLHTNIQPWDYFTGKADAQRGLAKVATLVRQARAEHPDCNLLLDTGDTLQGTPLGTYYALVDNAPRHPMAVAMSALGYDAMALGNHEFNYGLGVLGKFKSEVNFPLLGANVRHEADGGEAFTPYLIKDVCGVKVGILGLVTPGVTTWERPENIPGLRFDDPLQTARTYVPRMRQEGADVVVVAIHSGPDKQPTGSASDPASWLADYADPTKWADRGNLPGENEAVQIAQEVEGIDVMLTGHTHQPIPKMLLKNPQGQDVLLIQPNRWGSHLGQVDLSLVWEAGHWKVDGKDSLLRKVDDTVAVDAEVDRLTQGHHQTTVAYVNTPIGSTRAPFPGGFAGRYVDSALGDLINTVQEEAAAEAGHPVDFSLAALFTNDGQLPAGRLTLRDAYSIYIYDNTLYVMRINGSILRRALEHNTRYLAPWNPAAPPDASKPETAKVASVADYNWDLYSRIEYGYDLTKPQGSRLTHLRFKGQDVKDTDTFTIAINNYRGGGGGGYSMFKEGTLVWTSADGVRDYIARYVEKHPDLDPDAVNTCNFVLSPDLYAYFFRGTLGPAKCAP
ncbi:bifunctional metallophosphatase/5'-nucleotidase [Archangium primigenium]|uniref:bifunctional metallophosphatase/5'-nucleotidase n=1 Tax=[Archangium] primigenium TaxID=2792470 RepID=UPI0019587F12|nr:5'-nucleotidase C-terminal domain-containing protein [Archangium primigenium]MBM7114003.1 5'-nucleotidase C-terminal domain-containing protein [Archangium primigenium]